MNRETLLAAGIAAVVAVSLVAAAAVPGALADPEDDTRPGSLRIEEVTIAPGAVSGGSATLTVDARLDHWGGTTENATVLVRAVHLDSGLVETTAETAVDPVSDRREVSVVQNLTVERAGGYRVETVVYRDGERVASGRKEVRGVGSLTPAYARTDVRFHWQSGSGADGGHGGVPPIEYTVADAGENRTALNVSTYLTNQGDGPSEALRVTFTVRQAESNIVAARASARVGAIRPGRTATPGVEVTVPDGYNYYLDAVLWKEGVIVGTARSVANLDPTETVEADETVREVGIEVSDFETDGAGGASGGRTTVEYGDAGSGGVPGFTAVGALVALVCGLALARRNA